MKDRLEANLELISMTVEFTLGKKIISVQNVNGMSAIGQGSC